jgi:hypothetical protein
LATLAASEEFNYATNSVLKNHKRMADRELALRFCALKLWREGWIGYEDYHGSMDVFLDAVNEKLGTSRQIDDSEQKRLASLFINAMRNSIVVFDRYAFRKAEGAQLNKSLFDSISVSIAEYEKSAVETHSTEIREKIDAAIENDSELIGAVSQSTNSVRKVKYRFDFMEKLLSEIIR